MEFHYNAETVGATDINLIASSITLDPSERNKNELPGNLSAVQ